MLGVYKDGYSVLNPQLSGTGDLNLHNTGHFYVAYLCYSVGDNQVHVPYEYNKVHFRVAYFLNSVGDAKVHYEHT